MKSSKTMTVLTGFTLWTILLTFGCGSPPNTNVSGNQTTETATNADPAAPPPTPANVCAGTDPQLIANRVNAYLNHVIANDASMSEVKSQMARGYFRFRAVVTETPVYPPTTPPSNYTSVYLYLGGRMTDKRGANPKNSFQPLLAFIKNHHNRACVNKVVFVPYSRVPEEKETLVIPPIEGFEWLGCDAPNIPCPGGECAPSCLIGGGNSNGNSNSNSGSNSNSNANTNSNSNSNSNKPNP